MNPRREYFDSVKRVVVKMGSGVLTLENDLNREVIKSVSSQICALMDSGLEVLLVSSGPCPQDSEEWVSKGDPKEFPNDRLLPQSVSQA